MVALDGDGLGDREGVAVAIELGKLSLHSVTEPERAGTEGQSHQDEQGQTDAQQAEEPAALPSQTSLSLCCIHDWVASSARDHVRHPDTIS